MKPKRKQLISGIVMGTLFLLGVFLPQAAEAKLPPSLKAGQVQEELGKQIQKTARFNWAEGVLTETVQATLRTSRSSDAAPRRIPSEALFIIRSTAGLDHERNLRLALTLLEKETGRSLVQILPGPDTSAFSGSVRDTKAGWGGFWEFGFFTLASFVFSMLMFSWVWTDLECPIEREERKPRPLRKAA